MLGNTTNPQLQQTEQAVQARVPSNLQMGFQRVVTAGLTLMYSTPLHQRMLQGLGATANPESNAAQGAANILGTLLNQSRGKMPVQLVVPAAIVVMCEILDFLAQAGKLRITPELIGQCTKDTGDAVLKMLKISQGQVHQVVARGMSRAHGQLQGQLQRQHPAVASANPPRHGIIAAAMGGR